MTPKNIFMLFCILTIAINVCESRGRIPMRFFRKTFKKAKNVAESHAYEETVDLGQYIARPANCRTPDWNTCECKRFMLDKPCMVVRWYFEEFEKICRPLCTDEYDQITSDTRIALISSDILDMPKTKRQCDSWCGEPCVVTYYNHSTAETLGVCMDETWCDIFPNYSKWEEWFGLAKHPCKHFDSNCCPRDYVRSFEHHPYLVL